MSKHNLADYKILVRIRSGRTLLVEGDSDRIVMHRLLHDLNGSKTKISDRPMIDTPALLSDTALSGLGHKEQVVLIASECGDAPAFAALVDREWHGFNDEFYSFDSLEPSLQGPSNIRMTIGHSIENYFFEWDNFESMLKRQHAPDIDLRALEEIKRLFHSAQSLALAYSIAIEKASLITRLMGALRRSHLDIADNSLQLNASFLTSLQDRGVERGEALNLLTTVNDKLAEIASRGVSADIMKWASHGHLGHDALWAAVAKVAEAHGVDRLVCDQIERGNQADKLRHAADVLARGTHYKAPLDALAEWLIA